MERDPHLYFASGVPDFEPFATSKAATESHFRLLAESSAVLPLTLFAFTSTPSSTAFLTASRASFSRRPRSISVHGDPPPPIPAAAITAVVASFRCSQATPRPSTIFSERSTNNGSAPCFTRRRMTSGSVNLAASQHGVAPISSGGKLKSRDERRVGVHERTGKFASAP